jgi:hypothetical protein
VARRGPFPTARQSVRIAFPAWKYVVSNATSNAIVHYTVTEHMMHCPSFGHWFIKQQAERVIVYNHHGGHTNTPWKALPTTRQPGSPLKN